jgi:hypothetical protein
MLCVEVAITVKTVVVATTAVELDECFFYSNGGRGSAASYSIAYHHSMQYPTEEAEAFILTETVNTHWIDANNTAPTMKDRLRVSSSPEAGKAVTAIDDAAGTA